MPEQRKHERYKAPNDTIATADGSRCRIVDISKGGLSLMFLDGKATNIPKELSVDFLPTDAIKKRRIRVKLVCHKGISLSVVSGMVYKYIGVQFCRLTPRQKAELDELILKLDIAGSA